MAGSLSAAVDDALRNATLDALYQGVVVTDATVAGNPIVYCNHAFVRLTGYTRAEALGQSCSFLQGPGTDPTTLAELRASMEAERPFFGELLNYRKDGSPFWNALSITPLRDEEGVLRAFVGSLTDVTPLKEVELVSQQRQRLEILGTFARGIAHDFNNVLLATSGYAELLGRGLVTPEHAPLRRWVDQIVSSCESGRRLTRQLLDFSRGAPAEPKSVDLAALTAETAAMVGRLLPPLVTLRTRLEPRHATVVADRSQLEQVLLNLLVNARDAITPPGEIVVTVTAGESVQLSVSDTGSGIDPAVREHMFEPFFTTKEHGDGLGLSTTAAIVTRIGGTIDVSSDHTGTTFTVSLPRQR